MLRRAVRSSHGQSRSLAYGSSLPSLQQHTVLATRPTFSSFKHANSIVHVSRRTLSTKHDDTNEAKRVGTAPGFPEEDLKLATKNAEDHTVNENDSDSNFTITPRFTSRLRARWIDPEHQEEVAASEHNQSTEDDDGGHFLPIPDAQRQQAVRGIAGSIGDLIEEMRIPLSPLERIAEAKEWRSKRQPTEQEKIRLSYNPWAKMLASSTRMDQVSKTRLPQSLLVSFGQISNPEQTAEYLLPDDLTDFTAYEKRLQKAWRRLAMQHLSRERGGSKVFILPYKSMVEELTEELVVWDSSTGQGRTRYGAIVKRLLPPRWLGRNLQINAYQKASSEYWKLKERQEELDDGLFKKPEKPNDLLALQWQPNIAERMLCVMRQRLLLSIDHLGRKPDQLNNNLWKHFACFEWPSSLYLDIIDESSRNSDLFSDTSEKPEYAVVEHGESTQHHETQAEPDTPEDEQGIEQDDMPDFSSYRLNDPNFWLPGSYFLHVGPPETAQTALPLLHDESPASSSISKLNPPMIAVSNNIRLPVFNLPALLGPRFDHPLHQILTLRNMTTPNSKDDDSANKNYLIHIRATAPGSHYILKELWQLWRYVGGTDCFQPPSSRQALGEAAKLTQREQKEKIKKYKMNKKTWDNFYAFLPDIKRKPADD